MVKPTFATGDVPSATQVNEWFVNVLFARKTADESVTSSTTLQDDNDLSVSVAANAVYELSMVLRYDGSTAGDLLWQIVGPSGSSMHMSSHRLTVPAVGIGDDSFSYEAGTAGNAGALGVGVDAVVQIQGIVIVAATAGTTKLQWAQNTSSATATRVRAGSFMRLTRVD